MTQIWSDDNANGPNPYTTGGFTVTTSLASVTFFAVQVKDAGTNLGQASFQVTLNSPAAGQVTVKILRQNYDKLTAIGAISNLPASVSSRGISGGVTDTVSHLHDMSHDHAVTPASTGPAGASAATLAVALQPNVTTHTHTLNLPNFVANTANESAHTHAWNSLYAHSHGLTNTQTDLALTELAAGLNLTTTKFNWIATD